MEIYISQKFVDELGQQRAIALKDDNEEILELTGTIKRLICSNIKLSSNYSFEQIKHLVINTCGNKKFNNLKEVIAQKIIKSSSVPINFSALNNIDCKSFLFLDNTCNVKTDNGVIRVNFENNETNFYLNSMITQKTFRDEYEEIEDYIPRVNCMIYIDPYLLEGTQAERDKKNINFVKFICANIKNELDTTFHLSVISKLGQYNHAKKEFIVIPQKNIDDLIKYLSQIQNINFQIVLSDNINYNNDKTNRYRDRVFFTNYTMGSFGHPNDGKTTYFNQKFIAISKEINKDYDDYIQSLRIWKNFIKSVPITLKGKETRYGNNKLNNRIFDSL